MKKITLSLMAICALCACNSTENNKNIPHYFDLATYMKGQIKDLQAHAKNVSKTVKTNTQTENKEVQITDWKKELSVFTDADINKTAWNGYFKKSGQGANEIYESTKEDIPIKYLKIEKTAAGNITLIQIISKEKNALYESMDSLSYYPDSLYVIIKHQKTSLLEAKRFEIRGLIKR